jgi:hypothetical protein
MVGSGKMWLGKDYVNFIHKDFVDLDMPYHGMFQLDAVLITSRNGKLIEYQLRRLGNNLIFS